MKILSLFSTSGKITFAVVLILMAIGVGAYAGAGIYFLAGLDAEWWKSKEYLALLGGALFLIFGALFSAFEIIRASITAKVETA